MKNQTKKNQLHDYNSDHYIISMAEKDGWNESRIGQSPDYNDQDFTLLIRKRKFGDQSQSEEDSGAFQQVPPTTKSNLKSQKARNYAEKSPFPPVVSEPGMGGPNSVMTPTPPSEPVPVDFTLHDFTQYPSLAAIRSEKVSFVVAYDSEWYYSEDLKRHILSWQFACIYQGYLWEFVFIRRHQRDLSLEMALGCILDKIGFDSIDMRRVIGYACVTGLTDGTSGVNAITTEYENRSDAVKNSVAPFEDGKKVRTVYHWDRAKPIPVTLVSHAGLGDISGFDQSRKQCINLLKYCKNVQGGLITLHPVSIHPRSLLDVYVINGHPHAYPISLEIADTMCHAPGKRKKLEDLGEVIHHAKIELSDEMKSHMHVLLKEDPCLFLTYASNDSVVTLLYCASLYGINRKIPVTVTSSGARIIRDIMMEYLGCRTTDEFDLKYRGIRKVGHGLVYSAKGCFLRSESKESISDDAHMIQDMASSAYHGGYNSSSEIGYYPIDTYDYDLKNAYPTAMCLIPDIDWERPIRKEYRNQRLTLIDFMSSGHFDPLKMILGYVTFRFPESVKYPCIPVNEDGVLLFPKSSDGLDGVYACGPELYLALMMGAEVVVKRGYLLNVLVHPSEEISYSMKRAVKQFVTDRTKAKRLSGKGSLEELILKELVNAGYGKIAQDVVEKRTWSAYSGVMEDIGCSSITNPVLAAMITSLVRAVLLAAQNQCSEKGYKTYSVTTDGFIADIPKDVLYDLDLYGFKLPMKTARLYLTEGKDPSIWEIKHQQNDLLNFTTRGNVSLSLDGVCAHNGWKSGCDTELEDRKCLYKAVAGRTGPVDFTAKEFPGLKDVLKDGTFRVKEVNRKIHMDYDMKRKPVRSSFETVTVSVDGAEYELANFSTTPFESVEEFIRYRKIKTGFDCLRTVGEWNKFWMAVDGISTNLRIRDYDWSVLSSCIAGYRQGMWDIPALHTLTGKDRIDWINRQNFSGKRYTETDWKNAGRSSRKGSILPYNVVLDKLDQLQMSPP